MNHMHQSNSAADNREDLYIYDNREDCYIYIYISTEQQYSTTVAF